MIPLTETAIRSAFINTSRGEAERAHLPDLSRVHWEELDYLGWQDRRKPLQHYVVLEMEDGPRGLMLRGTGKRPVRKLLCAWCQDVVDGNGAASFVAPLAGPSGRRGNTIGTMLCADFGCSRNVRRPPTSFELRTEDESLLASYREQRIASLRQRSAAFVQAVLSR